MQKEINDFFTMYQLDIDTRWINIQAYKSDLETIDDDENEKIILEWDTDTIAGNAFNLGLFVSIYNNSNIKIAPQLTSNFAFLPEFYFNKKFVYFGTDHGGLHYALDKKTKKIALIDIETNKLLLTVAENELAFLRVLTKTAEFSQLFDGKTKMTASTSIKYRNECIQLAGGQEYAKLYTYTVISEDDLPDGPFYLSQ